MIKLNVVRLHMLRNRDAFAHLLAISTCGGTSKNRDELSAKLREFPQSLRQSLRIYDNAAIILINTVWVIALPSSYLRKPLMSLHC